MSRIPEEAMEKEDCGTTAMLVKPRSYPVGHDTFRIETFDIGVEGRRIHNYDAVQITSKIAPECLHIFSANFFALPANLYIVILAKCSRSFLTRKGRQQKLRSHFLPLVMFP